MGLVVLAAAHHSFTASTWITIANHGLLICLWTYHGVVPPVFLVATAPTLLLTLPLPVARAYAIVALAHRMAMEREPVTAFISLWLVDLVTSGGIAVMVLNMKVGESRERFISRSAGESLVDVPECGERTRLLHQDRDGTLRANADEHYSTLHGPKSLTGSTEGFITTQQWKDMGYQGPSPESVTTIWKAVTYHWLSDVFKLGASKCLEPSDCCGVPESMRCERLNDQFHFLR